MIIRIWSLKQIRLRLRVDEFFFLNTGIHSMFSSFVSAPCIILIRVAPDRVPLGSVVEPFHFGPAPAPASQDGGSSSSPVVHNLLLKKKF